MNLQLVRIGEQEISVVQSLANRIWRMHYPAVIGIEQVEYMLSRFYSGASMVEQMGAGQQFYLVMNGDMAIGFVSITKKSSEEFFVNKFYIDVSKHRQGIGQRVFELLLLEMGAGVRQIRLQVNRQNYKPINFYFKLGFVIEEVADFDIGDGYFMNDFVMLWNAKCL